MGLGLALERVGVASGGDFEGRGRAHLIDMPEDARDVRDRVGMEERERREVVGVAEVRGGGVRGRAVVAVE